MIKHLLPVLLFAFIVCLSCSKSDPAPSENNGTSFNFVSLVAQDTLMSINGITTIRATATGQGLTFNWSASYGSFIGSGSSVQWTVCHADKFKITCEVKDASGNSDTKEVYINVR